MKTAIACTIRARLKGLAARTLGQEALLLVPCRDIHTFGMKAPIDVAFIAGNGTVLKTYRKLAANRRVKCSGAAATLERFASDDPWLHEGDIIDISAGCILPSCAHARDGPDNARAGQPRKRACAGQP